MEKRDEALDFIYKGWREGRQQRRDVRNQRGADRIAARRERMANYGSTNMPYQVRERPKSGPPSRRNVASSPPSSETYVSPVQQYLEREGLHQPQEQTSSTTTGNFTDDISTPDDESTPQNEAIQEAVSSPPSLSQAFSNLGVPEHRPTGGANVGRHDYVNEGFPERTPDITRNVPSPAEVQQTTPQKDLGTRLPDGQDPFPTNYANLTDEERSQTVEMLGQKHGKLSEGKEMYEQALADGKITQDQAKEGIENYTKHLFQGLPPSMIPAPKSNEQQHQEAFEPAYEEMMNEATQPEPSETKEVKKPKKKVKKPKETKTPKPDETVSQAAKKTIKPAKEKATKKGKDAVREASERLANAGMTGKKSKEPKKAAGKKKAKGERKRQDLTGIKKPDDSDLRRSADQQMLADVLLKKLPVADLRMVNTMLGGGVNLPVLVDDMGFITQGQAVDPSHIMMTGISDNPNPFETDIDPRLLFDLDKLKIRASPTRFPGVPAMTTSRNKLLEAMTDVPMKRVQRLDDKGKHIPTGKKDKFGKPTYEMESVEDEDIGFFIRDGKNKKRMTPEEATEILDSRKKAKSQPQVKIDFASPYWSENQWNIPITSAGKTSTLPNVFGMMQTSEGADPNQRERSFISDPRRSSSSSVDWSGLKEVASISPADFKRRINEVKDDMVRIGDAKFDAEYLKQIAQAMKPSDMANEDIVLTGMQNAPLFFAGRGVKRYDEEPSYFETILAPRVDDMANRHELLGNEYGWESMNDLFE